jgi:hypothetical protein
MSRCFMDTDGSTMLVSHKTARADVFVRGLRIRHGRGLYSIRSKLDSWTIIRCASVPPRCAARPNQF